MNEIAESITFKEVNVIKAAQIENKTQEQIILIEKFLESCNYSYSIIIPYQQILMDQFNIEDSTLYFTDFLDLIKCITFFNQKKRPCFQIPVSEDIYLIAHPNDFIYAYEAAKEYFATPLPYLKPKIRKFLEDVFWLFEERHMRQVDSEDKKPKSFFDIWIHNQDIVNHYGEASNRTLESWLKDFKNLGLLNRYQKKSGAKVYYSLKRRKPLNITSLNKLINKCEQEFATQISNLKKDKTIDFYNSPSEIPTYEE